MNKLQTVEDFYYNGDKVEKGSILSLIDVKVGFCRSGILAKVEIESEDEGKQISDWIDLGMVLPMKQSTSLPNKTDYNSIESIREKLLDKDDLSLYESWKALINEGEAQKVIKYIVARLTSDKFGL
jgi:hypothetical protein